MIPMLLLPIVVETTDLGPTTAPEAVEKTAATTLLPPLRYQGNTGMHLVLGTPQQLASRCKDRRPESHETRVARACADKVGGEWVIFAPNPCHVPEVWGVFAGWLCHEVGHVNGWTEAHEQ